MKKQPRLVYEIRFSRQLGLWVFYSPNNEPLFEGSKSVVIDISAERLTNAWELLLIHSELVIKTKTGRIQDKRTYGADPRETKG